MSNHNSATDGRTLHVYVDQADRLREQTKRRVRAAEAGKDVSEIGNTFVLNFDSEVELARLLSPANLELLRIIRRRAPDSMRAAAALVDRDFKEVHRNLTELSELGLIELIEDGRAKQPVTRYDSIEIHYPLVEPTDEPIGEPV